MMTKEFKASMLDLVVVGHWLVIPNRRTKSWALGSTRLAAPRTLFNVVLLVENVLLESKRLRRSTNFFTQRNLEDVELRRAL